MKTLNISLDDKQFKLLSNKKAVAAKKYGKVLSWERYLLLLAAKE